MNKSFEVTSKNLPSIERRENFLFSINKILRRFDGRGVFRGHLEFILSERLIKFEAFLADFEISAVFLPLWIKVSLQIIYFMVK